MSASEANDWACTRAMPSEEEIRRVRRLIERVRRALGLSADDGLAEAYADGLLGASRSVAPGTRSG
ncbi:hypothetical protein [Streptomyces sp. NPDC001948]